jgi:Fe-S oxidoreductase
MIDEIINQTKAYYCLGCGKCTSRCPLAKASSSLKVNHAYSPRALIGYALQEAGFNSNSNLIWSCLGCNSCGIRCPSDVNFPLFIRYVRAALKKEGKDEQRLCSKGGILSCVVNIMARKYLKQNRLNWIKGLKIAKEGDTLYFVGCIPYFDVIFKDMVNTSQIAKSMVKIMNRCGIVPVVLEDEVCCGHDKLWSGEEETFKSLAEKNAKMIKERGIKRIITTCPECYRTLKLDYPRYVDFDFEVLHSSQFIEELGKRLKLELKLKNNKATVTYHDPCRLGKHMGIYDEPRSVISSIVDFKEMPQVRSESTCCGTSAWINCDKLSEQIRLERLSMVNSTLITACPKCQIHFRCTQNTNKSIDAATAKIEIKDLVVLVGESLK